VSFACGAGIRLSALALETGGRVVGEDASVSGVSADSRVASRGDLFVAIRGSGADGRAHAGEALARGATAVCSSEPVDGVPTLVVDDPRASLGGISATVYGNPCRELTSIGVTGTLGKTSTVELIEAALAESGISAGVIGSLGIRFAGHSIDTGMTTPEAPVIQRSLREMADQGVRVVAMEVTSHSLALGRVNGLCFHLGVFTNLVDDEHLDFHGTFEKYVETKFRYFGFLEPGAPLVYNADEPMLIEAAAKLPQPAIGVSLEGSDAAVVHIEQLTLGCDGTSFRLRLPEALQRLDGSMVRATLLAVEVPMLGIQHVMNAALAAVASLIAGASTEGVSASLASVRPIRRRMEVLRRRDPLVIDDTVGNPRSLRAVFSTLAALGARRVRLLYGIRGSRGVEINRRLAEEIVTLAAEWEIDLIVTGAEDSAGPRDSVTDQERREFLAVLDAGRVTWRYEAELQQGVRAVLENAGAGETVLLLGAGGMDEAAAMARPLLHELPG
jgi:UDP-N-acetylmuramoyl-L-alanyl-D-glutamate--2,6-diaminopimelate ligase